MAAKSVVVMRSGLGCWPFHEQTFGQARENPIHPDGVAVVQLAFIVAPGAVEPRVLPALDAPVLAIERQPEGRVQLVGRGHDHA